MSIDKKVPNEKVQRANNDSMTAGAIWKYAKKEGKEVEGTQYEKTLADLCVFIRYQRKNVHSKSHESIVNSQGCDMTSFRVTSLTYTSSNTETRKTKQGQAPLAFHAHK